ncbi:MAG: type II secretion system protein GspN [Desulfobacteraceae bacterium]|nr:type II secretion system protein GspN [Desulfobacteraceae bacterium]
MKTPGKILLYSLYTIAAVCVFLYLLFPSKTVSDIIKEKVAKANPDVQLSTEEASPVFPPGLKLKPLELAFANMPLLRMDYLKVAPGLLSAFSSDKNVTFNGRLGHGTLRGRAELSKEDQGPQTKITVNLANVPTDAFEILDQWPAYQLVGDVTAFIDYDSKKGAGGTTNLNMEITPTKIIFSPSLMGIEQLEFSQVQTEISVTPRMLQIKRCDLSGTQIEGKITGSIVFRRPFENSRLTLSCTIKPQPAFLADQKNSMIAGFLGSETAQKRGIVLRISGTVGKPSYVIR